MDQREKWLTPLALTWKRLAEKKEGGYTGILDDPIPEFSAIAGHDDDEISGLLGAKIEALFRHYEIDTNDASKWTSLALHLAMQHVRGFRFPGKAANRPAERKSDDLSLWLTVELLKLRDGMEERAACRQLVGEGRFPGTGESLRTRLKNFRKTPFGKILVEGQTRVVAGIGADAYIDALEGAIRGDE